jgi:hypothetical protein
VRFNACYFASYSFSSGTYDDVISILGFNACYFASYSFRTSTAANISSAQVSMLVILQVILLAYLCFALN